MDLEIESGSLVTILGPSGCGKSTLLRILAGLERPTSGSVMIDGVDVTAVPPHRRPTNLVFQDGALFPHLNVQGNVEFGLRAAGVRRRDSARRAAEAIELVDLQRFAKRMPHELSGGQRQRVAIARALVNEPSVLLLDEPLSALDLQLQISLRSELRALQRRIGTTFVWVTHNQAEALEISDRVAVVDAGRIVQVGRPDDVWRRPSTEMVAGFVGQNTVLTVTSSDLGVMDVSGGWRISGDAVRGEKIVVRAGQFGITSSTRQDVSGDRSTKGTITTAAFQGDRVVYRVSVESDSVEVTVSVDAHQPQYAVGDDVDITIPEFGALHRLGSAAMDVGAAV
ncbi:MULTISPECIES: ABC transporter ATP-binding protein [unclassified Rhodococcus (in: high G+C Gram-positive bacteria)]|uniref:ABC transporter ATP-binding protein n=1 Tax=unclassified Rhodococcus (in: high G+C Gram-positive bacteria) TaxID=192944 RepID=UPI0027E117F1|nr:MULTISPECIES: ABC transporter ATP-binding protein [unclassified Rhodococcus (in: high G+C Gram-positive bacteria)]